MRRMTFCLSLVVALTIVAGGIGVANAQSGPTSDGEWLIGKWVHRGETPNGQPLIVKRVCQRTLGDHYLTARTQIEVAGEVVLKHQHMLRYDPVREKNHSWVFSSNGDFVHGLWEQRSTRTFGGELVGQTVDGKRKTASANYEWVDGNTYIYRCCDVTIGGVGRPEDIEWDFHRVQ